MSFLRGITKIAGKNRPTNLKLTTNMEDSKEEDLSSQET